MVNRITSAITPSGEVDKINEIITNLNGKADIDLSNINASSSAKNTIIEWIMPDYTAGIDLSSGSSAPSNGWIRYHSYVDSHYCDVYINNVAVGHMGGSYYDMTDMLIPVTIGDVITWSGSGQFSATFFPCKGVTNA